MDYISVEFPLSKQRIYCGQELEIFESMKKNIEIVGKNIDIFYIVIDQNIQKLYPEITHTITNIFNPNNIVKYQSIASNKTIFEAVKLVNEMVEEAITRKSCIVVVGGGMMGDLRGFIASIYMRGIDRIFIPTTMMSQVDSTIGKIAINGGGRKNIVGYFGSPSYTYCIDTFIQGLPFQLVLEGLVEVWKHCLLVHNDSLLKSIESIIISKNVGDRVEDIVQNSLAIKKKFVEVDPFDRTGEHKAVSLGHILANYLETYSNITHGQAVYCGLIFDIHLSDIMKLITKEYKQKMLETGELFKNNLTINSKDVVIELLNNIELAINFFSRDKINSKGTFYFLLPTMNGYCKENINSQEIIEQAMTLTSKFI